MIGTPKAGCLDDNLLMTSDGRKYFVQVVYYSIIAIHVEVGNFVQNLGSGFNSLWTILFQHTSAPPDGTLYQIVPK